MTYSMKICPAFVFTGNCMCSKLLDVKNALGLLLIGGLNRKLEGLSST